MLAAAGLNRIGRIDEATDFLSPDTVLPAPGQGALAIECPAADAALSPPCSPSSTTSTRGPP